MERSYRTQQRPVSGRVAGCQQQQQQQQQRWQPAGGRREWAVKQWQGTVSGAQRCGGRLPPCQLHMWRPFVWPCHGRPAPTPRPTAELTLTSLPACPWLSACVQRAPRDRHAAAGGRRADDSKQAAHRSAAACDTGPAAVQLPLRQPAAAGISHACCHVCSACVGGCAPAAAALLPRSLPPTPAAGAHALGLADALSVLELSVLFTLYPVHHELRALAAWHQSLASNDTTFAT